MEYNIIEYFFQFFIEMHSDLNGIQKHIDNNYLLKINEVNRIKKGDNIWKQLYYMVS